jgi:hypothetical protein
LSVSARGLPSRETYFFERTGKGTDFVLHVVGQSVKLGSEILMELNFPLHLWIMDAE